MTPDLLASLAAALLSLACAYLPGLAPWYRRRLPTQKRAVMAACLLLVVLGAWSLACSTWRDPLAIPLTCDQPGLAGLARALVAALVANQATFLITPRPQGALP